MAEKKTGELIDSILEASDALIAAIDALPEHVFTEMAKMHIDDAVRYCIDSASITRVKR